MNPVTGMTTYFKPMGTGYFKAYGTPDSTFWCCNGTGTENYAKLNDSLYFHDATDLYVNSYVSSTLSWPERGLSLTQTTDLPRSNQATFTMTAAPAGPVKVKFRLPSWVSSCPITAKVNGEPTSPVQANGYLEVSRAWQAGDTLELVFPIEVQLSRLPDNPNAVAFSYGPVVLSAGLGTAQMTTSAHALTIAATKPAGVTFQDTITINSSIPIGDWIANLKNNLVQTPGKLEFTLKNTDSDTQLTFTPHYQRYQDRYGIYFKLAGTPGGGAVPVVSPCPGGTAGSSGGAGASGSGAGTGGTESAGAGGMVTPITTAGAPGVGGASNGGSSPASGGSGSGAASGGASGGSAASAKAGETRPSSASSTGCSCNLANSGPAPSWFFGLVLGAGLLARSRRRRRYEPRRTQAARVASPHR